MVRAADQFVPGATVTARQGDAKIVAFTDENGSYSMDLAPGVWDVQVEMFGFPPVHADVTVSADALVKNWTLNMPRFGEKAAVAETAKSEAKPEDKPAADAKIPAPSPAAAPTTAQPAAKAPEPPPSQVGAKSRKGTAPTERPGFQNATVKATAEGAQALAEAAGQPANAMPGANPGDDAEEAFLVSGSNSGGLAAASDEESRRQRIEQAMREHGDHGPPGGLSGSGPGGLGLPPGMGGSEGDSYGLGGLGASAINAGFADGPGGGPGYGGGPGGPPGSDRGRGSSRGDYGGSSRGGPGSGGPSGRRGSSSSSSSHHHHGGPYDGQFSSFGNRMHTQPSYTGSVYAYLNNSALNAAPFSLNGQTAVKPSYAQTRFGASFGGPLIIPKLVKWQRSSFYFTYSGSRSRNPYSVLTSVPTPAELGGDFSQAMVAHAPVTIWDNYPPQGQDPGPFPNNKIPVSRFNPASQKLLRYFPQKPTYVADGLIQNYQLVTSTPSTSDNLGVRFNAPLSKKDRLTFNFNDQTRHSLSQQLFGFHDTSTGGGLSASMGWSHSFKPRLNSSASLSFSRNNGKNAPYFAYKENVAAELGITGTSQAPIDYGPPNLSFTNFAGLSDGSASVSRSQTISFSEGITYILKKKHNLTFGFSYRRMQNNALSAQNARGSFSFSGLLTSQLTANGQPLPGTGFDFADFLLGFPQSSSLRYSDSIYNADNNYFRGWSTNTYAQDDYRISRRLSFNFGIRYEFFSPYTELHGHLANLDVSPGYDAVARVTPGAVAPYSGDLPSSLIKPDPNNLSPRFGFSLRPFHAHSTVIRGGYSIFFSGASYSGIASSMASQPPFAKTMSINTSSANLLTLQNGFPPQVGSQNITNTYSIDPNYKLAYAQTWTLAVQNSLPHGLFVELEYIGTKGTDLGYVVQPNRSTGTSLLTAQQNLRISNANSFTFNTDGANSSFNAGQVRMTRRFMSGMSGTLLYQFSKGLDDASSFNGTGGSAMQWLDNLRLERGLSNFDQRHRLSASYLLSSPVGIHGWFRNGGWKTKALTGWMLTGTVSAASGTPLTARVGGSLSNIGGIGAGSRAEATGLPVDGLNGAYFNPLAFALPPPGQYGDAGKCTIPGLFNMSVNASLNRAFRFSDVSRRSLQLRLSASNALNHVVITNIGTTVNSATYGLPTGASGTRTVQLMLRVSF